MDSDTAIGGPSWPFPPSTYLSLLEATADGMPNEALESVIALYWKPVYRFIRLKFRKDNEDAKDLTQRFFATALQRDFFARFDPTKASLRTYLRMAVSASLRTSTLLRTGKNAAATSSLKFSIQSKQSQANLPRRSLSSEGLSIPHAILLDVYRRGSQT